MAVLIQDVLRWLANDIAPFDGKETPISKSLSNTVVDLILAECLPERIHEFRNGRHLLTGVGRLLKIHLLLRNSDHLLARRGFGTRKPASFCELLNVNGRCDIRDIGNKHVGEPVHPAANWQLAAGY